MKTFEKVKFMRQLKGYSQEDIAEKLGMSVKGYSDIERGKTNLQMNRLEEIAQILGVDTLELLSFGEKNVFCQSIRTIKNDQNNFLGDSQAQIEKYQLIVEQKDKEISLLNTQITQLNEQILQLKEIIALMKNSSQS
jgi:transcriptional regulator with XRE-family HTH domain